MKTITKLILAASVLLILIWPSQDVKAAAGHITFQTDADWSSWVQKDVALAGSNSGLKLKTISGNYAVSGAIIYKVSPDGLATWGEMSQTQIAPTGTSIDFSFSSSEISIDQSYADLKTRADVKSKALDVGTSNFLYIRIDLFADAAGGVGVATPTLKTFSLDYTVLQTPSIYTEKHTYRYRSADAAPRAEIATFVPGDQVVVKIKLSATNASDLKFKVQDDLARNAETFAPIITIADAVKYCGLSATDTLLKSGRDDYPQTGDSLTVNDIVLDGVSGYLCYMYFVPNPTGKNPKNDIQQTRLSVSVSDIIISSSSNYIMVRGFAYSQSDTSKTLDSGTILQIDDELLFSFDKFIFKGISGQEISYASAPAYIYKRGIAAKSRGGDFYNLPVMITDSTGAATLSADSYYLLYNPSVYVMGNLFSKGSLPDSSLDFGARNNVVSGATVVPSESSKINAQASLYNYSIDSGSVAYWDSGEGRVRSQAMQKNIDRIVGTLGNRPENFCPVSSSDTSELAGSSPLYLNNKNCNMIEVDNTSGMWPEGRVWYFEPTGDVDLSAKIMKSGTLVFDFNKAPNANVRVGTIATDFPDGVNVGIILTNGGNVVFTKTAEAFNGMVFVPGTK
jgi:hypothetical protein